MSIRLFYFLSLSAFPENYLLQNLVVLSFANMHLKQNFLIRKNEKGSSGSSEVLQLTGFVLIVILVCSKIK